MEFLTFGFFIGKHRFLFVAPQWLTTQGFLSNYNISTSNLYYSSKVGSTLNSPISVRGKLVWAILIL